MVVKVMYSFKQYHKSIDALMIKRIFDRGSQVGTPNPQLFLKNPKWAASLNKTIVD